MRISTMQFYAQARNAILDNQGKLLETHGQVATGKRVAQAGDDVVAFVAIQRLRAEEQSTQRYLDNINTARQRLSIEDTTLDQITNSLQRVRELAIQSESGALSTADRAGIASELRALRDQLFGQLNSRDGDGQYLFSGYQANTAPFARDASGAFAFQGDEGITELTVAPGVTMPLGHDGRWLFVDLLAPRNVTATAAASNTGTVATAQPIVTDQSQVDGWAGKSLSIDFTSATQFFVTEQPANIPVAIHKGVPTGHLPGTPIDYVADMELEFAGTQIKLSGAPQTGDKLTLTVAAAGRQDLLTSVDALARSITDASLSAAQRSEAIADAIQQMDTSRDRISQARAQVGARLNSLDALESNHQESTLQTKEVLSNLEDLDFTEAISRLSQQTAALQAAQQSFATLSRLSLFNLLS